MAFVVLTTESFDIPAGSGQYTHSFVLPVDVPAGWSYLVVASAEGAERTNFSLTDSDGNTELHGRIVNIPATLVAGVDNIYVNFDKLFITRSCVASVLMFENDSGQIGGGDTQDYNTASSGAYPNPSPPYETIPLSLSIGSTNGTFYGFLAAVRHFNQPSTADFIIDTVISSGWTELVPVTRYGKSALTIYYKELVSTGATTPFAANAKDYDYGGGFGGSYLGRFTLSRTQLVPVVTNKAVDMARHPLTKELFVVECVTDNGLLRIHRMSTAEDGTIAETVTIDAGTCYCPQIRIFPNGDIYVTYSKGGQWYMVVSSNTGRSFGVATSVSTDGKFGTFDFGLLQPSTIPVTVEYLDSTDSWYLRVGGYDSGGALTFSARVLVTADAEETVGALRQRPDGIWEFLYRIKSTGVLSIKRCENLNPTTGAGTWA